MSEMTKRWNFDLYIAKEIADQADWMINHGHTVPQGSTAEEWKHILTRIRDDLGEYSRGVDRPKPAESLALFVEYFDKWWD